MTCQAPTLLREIDIAPSTVSLIGSTTVINQSSEVVSSSINTTSTTPFYAPVTVNGKKINIWVFVLIFLAVVVALKKGGQ